MQHNDLPNRWKNKIIDFLNVKNENQRKELNDSDFSLNHAIRIEFEDDSFAEFKYAFVIELPAFNEIGVFTEHCGYHIFNSRGLKVTIPTTN